MIGKGAFAASAAALTILLANALIADAQPVRRVERGTLVLEGIPDTTPALRERLRMYQAVRGAELMDFAPDGRGVLISTRFGETNQLHRVDTPNGMRRQITFYDEPVATALYHPSDRGGKQTILLQRDTGGNEVYQLYLVDEKSGDIARLTDGKSRNTDAVFSHDGKFVAWTSVPSDSSKSRILISEIGKTEAPDKVLEEDGTYTAAAFSPDNGTLAVVKDISAAEAQIWLVDLDAGTKTQLDPSPTKIFRAQPRFSSDGRYLFYISDENSEFRRLIRYDLKEGRKDVFTGNLPWDIEHFEISPDGRTLAFAVNNNGASEIDVWDIKRGRKIGDPKLPPGEVENLKFSRDSRSLGFTLNGTTGRDVFAFDVRGGRRLTQWTDSEVGGLDKAAFVAPQLVSYSTFDSTDSGRRTIPAYFYKPAGTGPFPVLIYIHGGPESQYRPNFNAFIQYLALELKIAVLAPNVRGSTGYGKAYVELDNGQKRNDAVKDIGAAIDWIGTQRELNAQRVGLYGGSYGGYLTYAAMIDYSDKVAAGISVSGISNFVTFLTNISGYRRDARRPEYGDERDAQMRDYLEKISPLTNASHIKKPLLIIAGANDPRIPVSEAEQMLRAVRANGADAWYLLAKDEGNGYQRKSNRDAENAAIAAFLKLKLLGQKLD
jgi:dipeptidyl aminopeptidase/acylaminoacyl peptidase